MHITRAFLEGMKQAGRQDDHIIDVVDRHIEYRTGCFACKRNGGTCIHGDDMRRILEEILESDLLLFSFQLYCYGMPAPLKALLDRKMPLSSMAMQKAGFDGKTRTLGRRCGGRRYYYGFRIGEGRQMTNDLRGDGKGRHTTTHRDLIILPGGVMVIDTPGMRELGMWDVGEGLSTEFVDIEALAEKCRFRDCTYQTEPHCAVRVALERGELSEARFCLIES